MKKSTEVVGLISGTAALGVPIGTAKEKYQKVSVNEVASEVFLRKFYDNNALDQPSTIREIAKELKLANASQDSINAVVTSLQQLQLLEHSDQTYNQRYTSLMIALSSIDIIFNEEIPYLTKLYTSVFDSDVLLINDVSERFHFHDMYDNADFIDEKFESRLKKQLGTKTLGLFDDNGVEVNNAGVLHPEGNLSKISGVIGINYAPQLHNNIPYVYPMVENKPHRKRLRIGTQIEQTFITPSVPKIFKNFLKALNVGQATNTGEINYLYINLQKTSKKNTDGLERRAESLRTNTLHAELSEIPGVAVVTLPADNSSFFKGFSRHDGKALVHKNNEDFVSLNVLFDEICTSIFENSNDFNIPGSVKSRIFGPDNFDSVEKIKEQLKELFNSAAKEMLGDNVTDEQRVSMEQRQAVYFHFVKSKVTELILDKLKPKYFNISCKDAIDRAGVHNLWGIICNRINAGQGMDLQEFELFLNMPAILVKDRTINHHVNVLSNALGQLYYHLSEEKKKLIPWVPAWLKVNSCWSNQKQDVSKIFTWLYDNEKAKQQYFEDHQVSYNDLYCAVSCGDDDKVNTLLLTPVNCSIYDNNTNKSDTVLMCAARDGKFNIFLKLLEAHDAFVTNKNWTHLADNNPLKNLRSNTGKNKESVLGLLFQHLEVESEENESTLSTAGTKTQVGMCIEKYITSILTVQGGVSSLLGKNYHAYFNGVDKDNCTPIMRLAKTGNYQMLNKVACLLSEKNGMKITDFFPINKEELIKLAVKGGGEQHKLFVKSLLTLTSSSEEENAAAIKLFNLESASSNENMSISEIFLQTLSERNPKTTGTVAAISLMKQLIIADNNVVSPAWVRCVKDTITKHKLHLDPYISSMFGHFCATNMTAHNESKGQEYEQMMILRIKIEIELEKNQLEFAEVVESIKKCRAASSVEALTQVDTEALTSAYQRDSTLQYSNENNRDDISYKYLNNYTRALISTITPSQRYGVGLTALMFDIDNNTFQPNEMNADVQKLITLARKMSDLQTRSGNYLSLYSDLTKLFNQTDKDKHSVLRENYHEQLTKHGQGFPDDIKKSFELLFLATENKVGTSLRNRFF